jgi:probable phosphoglycerate mutase
VTSPPSQNSAPRILYLARHGETDWNAIGRWQGQSDIPLNDTGRGQAHELAHAMRAVALTSVGSSDLSRARETAEIVARALGLPLAAPDASLRERAYGVFEGLTQEECRARHPVAYAQFEADPIDASSGVEPLASVVERMRAGVLRAARSLPSPSLLVSHGRAIRTLVASVTGETPKPLGNGGVYRLVLDEDHLVEAVLLPR